MEMEKNGSRRNILRNMGVKILPFYVLLKKKKSRNVLCFTHSTVDCECTICQAHVAHGSLSSYFVVEATEEKQYRDLLGSTVSKSVFNFKKEYTSHF